MSRIFTWFTISKNAKSAFDDAENGDAIIAIPTIVLAESIYVLEEERLELKFRDVVKKLEIGWNYTTIPLTIEIIKKVEEMNKIRELHDRIIVASANAINAELINICGLKTAVFLQECRDMNGLKAVVLTAFIAITKDGTIRKSGYVKTLW